MRLSKFDDLRVRVRERAESIGTRARGMNGARLGTRGKVAGLATVGVLGLGLVGAVTATAAEHPAESGGHRPVAAADAARAAQVRHADRAARPATPAKPPAQQAPPKQAPPKQAPPKQAPLKQAPLKQAPQKKAPQQVPPKKAPAKPAAAAPKPAWTFPMGKFQLTSCYGMRWGAPHQGIDFANQPGTPILAAAAGTVISAGWNAGGYGNMVIIQHGPSLYTLYGHSEQVLVHQGQHVVPGQPIALEGSTGDSTGPHLHFEVWNAMWSRIEPAGFLRAHGVALTGC